MVGAPASGGGGEVVTVMQQKTPPQTFEAAAATGAAKGGQSVVRTLALALLAGAYIGLGGLLALRVGGAVPGMVPGLQRLLLAAVGLPTGLTMVLVAGGELYTGNTMLLTAAWLSGRVGVGGVAKNWAVSFLGNLVGSLVLVKIVTMCGVLGGASGAAVVATAVAKTSLSFWTAFWRGVVCNWLVCLAVYMANGAGDLVSKFVAVLLPISAFMAMGMEHSVANMFLVPMGMKMGAEVGLRQFVLGNLLPVTLGNTFAGAVLVAGMYYLAFGRKK